MINFSEIPHDLDQWELFARDFLRELGFQIESPPDRGADGGKDLLVIEDVRGSSFRGNIRWLVSCKHFAKSQRAVNEAEESNILERVRGFRAQGFIGFYSTLATSGLNSRLRQLKDEKYLVDYQIFDHKLIESYLISSGFSELLLHTCHCGAKPVVKILEEMFRKDFAAIFVRLFHYDESNGSKHVKKVYAACKGECDHQVSTTYFHSQHLLSDWIDLSDLERLA